MVNTFGMTSCQYHARVAFPGHTLPVRDRPEITCRLVHVRMGKQKVNSRYKSIPQLNYESVMIV